MSKQINFHTPMYELCSTYPELRDILADLGFIHLKDDKIFNTAAKVMTIVKGASARNLNLEEIELGLTKHGFTINS